MTVSRLLTTLATAWVFFPLITCDECPTPLPDTCECGQEVHHGDTVKVVRCAGLTFALLSTLKTLPPGTELLIIKDSDLEEASNKSLQFESQSLRILHLERNSLLNFDLKSFLCVHPNLERVYLSDNSLIWFTIDPKCSQKLKLLSLRQNHINFLPNDTLTALGEMDNLRLDLSDNTFSCDCNLVPTLRWLQNQSQGRAKGASLVDPDLYVCKDAFPEGFMGRKLVDVDPDQLRCDGVGVQSSEDMDFYNYHSQVLYFMVGFLAFIALLLVIFSLYLHFPNISSTIKSWKEEAPRISNHKQYTSLNNETRA